MLFSLLSVTARLSGYFPDNDSPYFLPLLGTLNAMATFIMTLGAIATFSMFADLVDEQEHRVGYRQEGVFASGIALATKAIGSFGVLIGGILLDTFIGLEPGQASKEIPQDVIFRLAVTDAIIVNAFILLPAILISRYSLKSERVAEIQLALAERRKTEPQVSAGRRLDGTDT